ncbi:MAG: TQO small subunit DoxD [Candidatus Limnocylindrales bacterium]|jgi:thiosulfate dehydrogenase [quinone] large subunit
MDRTSRGIFVLRAVLGAGFLFAGLDKFFMWSGGTPFTAAGFLKFATGGAWLGSSATTIVNPTHSFWVSLAGNAGLMTIIDTLVVFGECAIGAALILGLATRFASICGVMLMTLLYVANWSFATGPFNEQLMYGLIAGTIAYVGAGAYALDSVVEKLAITRRIPVVKYALG